MQVDDLAGVEVLERDTVVRRACDLQAGDLIAEPADVHTGAVLWREVVAVNKLAHSGHYDVFVRNLKDSRDVDAWGVHYSSRFNSSRIIKS